jgi:hypothetical protein
MSRIRDRRQGPRDAGRRRSRPGVEGLEGRLLLFAPNGGEWAFGSRITYSFAPDGTDVGGTPSNLDAAMAARGIAAASWRDQFRRAFAAWQVAANINLVEVPDDGSPISTSGHQQGDTRFGDIRVAGIVSSTGVLGTAFLPPPINGGTLAGDVLLNTQIAWRINSDYDVMTVALHEIGHSLGLGHSNVSQTVMGYAYAGVQQTLKTDDINGIRSLYGVRPPDWLEGAANNDVSARATNINGLINGALQARIADLNIATGSDSDWYFVTAPAGGTGTVTVSMQSTALSSLGPRVQIYNASMQGLAQASSNAWGATVTVSASVTPGAGYYIRTMASGGGATAGAYGLIVNFGTEPAAPIEPPVTIVPEQPDQGGGSSTLPPNLAPRRLRVGNLLGYADILTTDGHGHHDHGDGHDHENEAGRGRGRGYAAVGEEKGGQGQGRRRRRDAATDVLAPPTTAGDDAPGERARRGRRRARPSGAAVDALLTRGAL